MELLGKVLKDKEGEIKDAKDSLHQAKKDAIREYHDSGALIKELGTSFADGCDDCFRQVKAGFPDLDLSHITIDAKGQTLAYLVESEATNELFADETNPSPQGDGEVAHADQENSIEDGTHQLEGDQTAEKNEEPPTVQQ